MTSQLVYLLVIGFMVGENDSTAYYRDLFTDQARVLLALTPSLSRSRTCTVVSHEMHASVTD